MIELKVIFKDKNKRSIIIKDLKKIHTMHTTNMAYVFASTPFAYGSGLYKHFDLKLSEVESITKDDELIYLNMLE